MRLCIWHSGPGYHPTTPMKGLPVEGEVKNHSPMKPWTGAALPIWIDSTDLDGTVLWCAQRPTQPHSERGQASLLLSTRYGGEATTPMSLCSHGLFVNFTKAPGQPVVGNRTGSSSVVLVPMCNFTFFLCSVCVRDRLGRQISLCCGTFGA